MAEYLDKPGVERLWQKIKAYVANNVVTPANITGNAGTATKLQTPRAIDGVTFDGSAPRHHYGLCTTSAATVAKSVGISGFTLVTGAKITVHFRFGISCANATLSVTSTGAKPIYYKGTALAAGNVVANTFLELVYTGSYWCIIGDLPLAAYPVGAIYLSISSVNPGTLFGGTWVRFGNGRVLVGVWESDVDFNGSEKIGGERNHVLTAAEMPRHNHAITTCNGGVGGAYDQRNQVQYGYYGTGYTTAVGDAGNSGAHNNMQPYITCYMWKRTA